ncbi:MAG: organomercurial lyase [Pseudomonadota bacterium]
MAESGQADINKVLAALKGLHRAFPIEQRLKTQACDSTRETYLAVLTRWVQTASAPSPAGFDAEALDELLALDALYLTEDEQAIGATPFSPVETDIKVNFPHETLYALSALDALALPRLLGSAGVIETRCPLSGQPIRLQIDAQGNPLPDDIYMSVMVFMKTSDHIRHYSLDLAPGIRFVHPSLSGRFAQTLGMAEAAAVSHAFYAFQRKMLAGSFQAHIADHRVQAPKLAPKQ